MRRILSLVALLLLLIPLGLSAQTVEEVSQQVQQHIEEGLYYDALGLIETLPDSVVTSDLVRQRARILSSFARYEEAADLVRPLVAADTLVPDLQLLAGLYEHLEKVDSAVMVREEIRYRSPYNIVNILRLSELYVSQETPFLALPMIDRFLERYPDNRPMRQERAAVNYASGYYDEAYEDFDSLYWSGDRAMNTVYYRGRSLMQRDSLDLAIPVLEEAVRLSDETNPYPMLDLAALYIRREEPKQSLLYLDKVDSLLERTPVRLQILTSYHDLSAEALMRRGVYPQALDHLKEYRRLAPYTTETSYREAVLYRLLNDEEREQKALNDYLRKASKADTDSVKPSKHVTYSVRRLEELKEKQFMEQK